MKRVATALVLIPPVLYLIFAAPGPLFLAAVVVVALLCFHEFGGLLRGYGFGSAGPASYAAGLVLLFAPRTDLTLVVIIVLLALVLALKATNVGSMLPRGASVAFGVLYVFGAWRCGIDLRQINPHWLFFTLVVNWIGDTAAYYAGRAFGRHKLAPVLSPKKSWEGSIASAVASVVFGLLYMGRFTPAVALWEIGALSLVANVAGQIGDLSESAIKRGAGVKDSGTLLPGHGGWLDRLDSSLFALPVVYFWLSRPWIGVP